MLDIELREKSFSEQGEDEEQALLWQRPLLPYLPCRLESQYWSGHYVPEEEKKTALAETFGALVPFFLACLCLLPLFLVGCGTREKSDATGDQLTLVTIKPLPTQQEDKSTIETAPLAEQSPEYRELTTEVSYDKDDPKAYLAHYLESKNLDQSILEDESLMNSLRGLDREQALYFLQQMLALPEADPVALAQPSEGLAESNPLGELAAGQPAEEFYAGAAAVLEPSEDPTAGLQPEETLAPTPEPTEAPADEVILPVGGPIAEGILANCNQLRSENGLPALIFDATLSQLAATRAREIVNQFSHTRPDGGSATQMAINLGYSASGENIAKTSLPADGVSVYTQFYNSDGHRQNMLRSSFTHIGIATFESGNYVFTVMYFGTP